jgi:hypothetical protein
MVAVVSYSARARCRLRPVSTGEGVLAVLAHSVPARRRPSLAVRTLGRALRDARVLVGVRGAADDAVRRLLGDETWFEVAP